MVYSLPIFKRNFPTSLGFFQLRSVLSNFAWLFPTSAKPSNFRSSNLKLSNFSFFPTALSNFTELTILPNLQQILIIRTIHTKIYFWEVSLKLVIAHFSLKNRTHLGIINIAGNKKSGLRG